MPRRFDHVDLRVPSLAQAAPFYARLLPALGFTSAAKVEGWLQLEAEDENEIGEFFGVTEDPAHVPNQTRIAFRAASVTEVDALGRLLKDIGARNIEGPEWHSRGCYAVFFEDPFGNVWGSPSANGNEPGRSRRGNEAALPPRLKLVRAHVGGYVAAGNRTVNVVPTPS